MLSWPWTSVSTCQHYPWPETLLCHGTYPLPHVGSSTHTLPLEPGNVWMCGLADAPPPPPRTGYNLAGSPPPPPIALHPDCMVGGTCRHMGGTRHRCHVPSHESHVALMARVGT